MDRHSPTRPAAVDVVTAGVAVAPAVVDQTTVEMSGRAWLLIAVWSLASAAPLILRRNSPVACFAATFVVAGTTEILASVVESDLTFFTVLPLGIALYSLGAYAATARAVVATLVGAAGVILGVWINYLTAQPDYRGGADVVASVAPLPLALAAGMVVRGSRAIAAVETERADAAVREQQFLQERARQAERSRIARDMHDVVAHSVTLLVVHAESLRARSADMPPGMRDQVDAMAAAGRQATDEMRDMLTVLSAGSDDSVPRGPTPGLADIDDLIAAARGAGNPVSVERTGNVESVDRQVGLTTYRVVQEGLANARRHATGVPVEVVLERAADTLIIEISSDAGNEPSGPHRGSGLGLSGLRERVQAVGGQLTSGPRADGGYRLCVEIPLATGCEMGGPCLTTK